MSAEYKNTDVNEIAKKAEQDLNSQSAVHGHNAGLSSTSSLSLSHPIIPNLLPPSPTHPSIHKPQLTPPPATESGVDTANVEGKFPGAQVKYGSAASGAGNNREIPLDEGGSIKANGQPTKAGDFAHGGVGAPEERDQTYVHTHGGDEEIRGNVRN